MANKDAREALRGAEAEIFDLISEVLTSQEWGKLLKGPLECAAATGKLGLAQRLVGARAEIKDALHSAIEGGHKYVASYLLENGASISTEGENGETPLHAAAVERETEILQQLLLKGADKDAIDHDGWTPLCFAADNLPAALILLAAGADVNRRIGYVNRTVLHVAAQGEDLDILRAMIRHGADVNVCDTIDGSTALHVAVRHRRVGAINVLIEAGANIEALDRFGSTPLHLGAFSLSLEVVTALLKHGARVNVRDSGGVTPLHDAACLAGKQGAAEMVDHLLRSGADETLVDEEGEIAADVIGDRSNERRRLADDFERVRLLLANAPADRAWRRRGYLVLCRAHPDRVKLRQESSSGSCVDVASRTRSRAKLAKTRTTSLIGSNETTGCSNIDETTGGKWTGVVIRVLRVPEEGIFRVIMRYL